jgi:chromosome segregation ATPase
LVIPPAQDDGRSAQNDTSRTFGDETSSLRDQDIRTLQRALQEQRRATTLLHAETEKERQLREALEAQLIEANAEIVASWDRRKEMARVMGELQTRLAQVSAERKDLTQQVSRLERAVSQREQTISKLEQVVSNREQSVSELKQVISRRDQAISKLEQVVAQRDQVISNREEALSKRDVALAKREMVVQNRDEKIRQLKAELQARYEDLAALQRSIVESSLSGRAKRLTRKAKGFARKTLHG